MRLLSRKRNVLSNRLVPEGGEVDASFKQKVGREARAAYVRITEARAELVDKGKDATILPSMVIDFDKQPPVIKVDSSMLADVIIVPVAD